MRLIDLDQTIVVPVEDETRGTSYEMQMSVGEFFDRLLEGFEPEIVDAVPVEWIEDMLREWHNNKAPFEVIGAVSGMLVRWHKEQEVNHVETD